MPSKRSVSLAIVAFAACVGNAAASPAPDDIAGALVAGADPVEIAGGLDAASAGDWHWLNAVRLRLKAAGHAADARRLLSAIETSHPSDAVLYNLSLSYVDQLAGHNLLRKGMLSTASVRAADEILQRRPDDWLARHIRGMNNLYWPDWFDRAQTARDDLVLAVSDGRPRLADHPFEDGLAETYLALGDALALTDKPAEARTAWAEGAAAYPYFVAFPARLALPDAAQHAAVRAERDSDKPVDTDLEHYNAASSPGRFVPLTGGTLYGPGPLPDQQLLPGSLNDLHLARPLTGMIPQMNNGTAEPHPPGEIAVGKPLNGLFSDATPVNKNVDVGHVFLMNGKFKLFLAAVAGGPNAGTIHMYLDHYWNWTIQDDIGIDPGFEAGIVKFQNFMFSTSPRVLPASTQTQDNEPGGVDRAGSLASGSFVPGLMGVDEEDGTLQGTFNAIGSFPLGSVFLPGAPFAQTRIFRTDIRLSPQLAGFVTLANAMSYLRASAVAGADDAETLDQTAHERLNAARREFAAAPAWVRGLDAPATAAYARLTAAAFNGAAARKRFVCDADADLAVLGDRLDLVRVDRDGSQLSGLLKCEAP